VTRRAMCSIGGVVADFAARAVDQLLRGIVAS
jgi:hypothetical protein